MRTLTVHQLKAAAQKSVPPSTGRDCYGRASAVTGPDGTLGCYWKRTLHPGRSSPDLLAEPTVLIAVHDPCRPKRSIKIVVNSFSTMANLMILSPARPAPDVARSFATRRTEGLSDVHGPHLAGIHVDRSGRGWTPTVSELQKIETKRVWVTKSP